MNIIKKLTPTTCIFGNADTKYKKAICTLIGSGVLAGSVGLTWHYRKEINEQIDKGLKFVDNGLHDVGFYRFMNLMTTYFQQFKSKLPGIPKIEMPQMNMPNLPELPEIKFSKSTEKMFHLLFCALTTSTFGLATIASSYNWYKYVMEQQKCCNIVRASMGYTLIASFYACITFIIAQWSVNDLKRVFNSKE